MENNEFFVKLLQSIWRGAVKGSYHADNQPISEECFGEWLIPKVTEIKDFASIAYEDPMAVALEDYHSIGMSAIDIHYKQQQECKFIEIGDEWKNWCLENLDVCVGYDEGFGQRIYDNAVEMFASFYDLVGLFMLDSNCLTDQETIDFIGKLVEDWSSIMSFIIGFDVTYDAENRARHIPRREFFKDV